ncbi:unnamed protein product [Adineta steineri]|uniref:Uncharacterized protein n=1 Tax=Adineta steineri TaxID=433720 RepID=A0A815F2A7_9BILA|nr:unnamed protein product [Adineta steineri]CAF1317700.1 unnamed protein product [Adineta steineri]
MKSILITGANRGIGLGIVKQLVSNPSSIEYIFAGYRDVNKSKELLDLAKQHSNVIIPIQIDVSDDESCNKAKIEVENKLGNSRGLNCLLNNAGVNKELKFNDINEKDMLDTYKHNVIGPWRVTKTFLPLVEKAVSGERNVLQASIINVSSGMGSVTLAPTMPFFYFDYQCSKAALDMFTVCFAETLAKSNIYITLLHPGWVQTEMGGAQAPLTIEEACKSIVECINSMKNEHYGKLVDATSGSSCAITPF